MLAQKECYDVLYTVNEWGASTDNNWEDLIYGGKKMKHERGGQSGILPVTELKFTQITCCQSSFKLNFKWK